MLTDDKLMAIINDYKELTHKAEQIREQADLLADTVKLEMMRRDVRTLALGPFKVSYMERNIEVFDKKEFKRMYYELYSKFVKNERRRYFSIR